MLGLPKSTELKKQLPKSAIYEKFNMNKATKDRFDADIGKIYIVNEISPITTTIVKGKNIESFFVLLVRLKREKFDEKNINLISKLINQNMLFILEYEGKSKIAVYHTKLMQTEWQYKNTLTIQLKGFDFDTVWQNVIVGVGAVEIEKGNTLDEQIVIDEQRQKLQKQIEKLEKQARTEKQPKCKFELYQQVQEMKKRLEYDYNA